MWLFESAHPVVNDLDTPAKVDVKLFKVIWDRPDATASLAQDAASTQLLFTMTRQCRKRSREESGVDAAAAIAAIEDDDADDAHSTGGLTEDLEGLIDLEAFEDFDDGDHGDHAEVLDAEHLKDEHICEAVCAAADELDRHVDPKGPGPPGHGYVEAAVRQWIEETAQNLIALTRMEEQTKVLPSGPGRSLSLVRGPVDSPDDDISVHKTMFIHWSEGSAHKCGREVMLDSSNGVIYPFPRQRELQLEDYIVICADTGIKVVKGGASQRPIMPGWLLRLRRIWDIASMRDTEIFCEEMSLCTACRKHSGALPCPMCQGAWHDDCATRLRAHETWQIPDEITEVGKRCVNQLRHQGWKLCRVCEASFSS